MQTRAVKVVCDVHCEWNEVPPRYRLYVNDELFMERTYIWKDFYLEEAIPIEAPPGMYQIRYELVGNPSATLKIKNARIEYGNGVLYKHQRLEIFP